MSPIEHYAFLLLEICGLKTIETLKPKRDSETAWFIDYEIMGFLLIAAVTLELNMIMSPHSPKDIIFHSYFFYANVGDWR